jgi:hypothetical protein
MKKTLILMMIAALSVTICTGLLPRELSAQHMEGAKTIQLPVMVFDLAPGPNLDKVQGYCAVCHGTEYIPMQPRMSKQQWTGTVTKMIKVFGAPIPQEDADKIIDYLATAYGTEK